jgi:hypothetical protein
MCNQKFVLAAFGIAITILSANQAGAVMTCQKGKTVTVKGVVEKVIHGFNWMSVKFDTARPCDTVQIIPPKGADGMSVVPAGCEPGKSFIATGTANNNGDIRATSVSCH